MKRALKIFLNDILPQLAVLILIVGLLLLPPLLWGNGVAQAAPAEEVEACVPFAQGEGALVYRCEDWQMGTTCYLYGAMMFCVKD